MRAKPARVMAALRDAFDLNVAEGWNAFRRLKAALDHAPGLVDLDRHPRITAREVRAARQELVKEDVLPRAERALTRVPASVEDYVPDYDEGDLVEFEFSADTAGET